MRKAFEKNLQNFLTQAKEVQLLDTEAGRECKDLAGKYNVPFMNDGKADAKCPGIMNPIGEQPKIEFQWGNPSHNEDKHTRWNEFRNALKAYDNFVNNNESFKTDFLNLKVHGRVMFDNIAKVNNNQEALKAIALFATEGLNMDEVPFGKGSAKVSDIFGHYIASDIAPYIMVTEEATMERTEDPALSLNNNNNIKQKDSDIIRQQITEAFESGKTPEDIKDLLQIYNAVKTEEKISNSSHSLTKEQSTPQESEVSGDVSHLTDSDFAGQ
ncbi:MAG: hypothetical protein K0R02_898 [Rickettsiaceae bacterium]|jgi:hypothetical protein|nr:hypothetical protein [Rickettsiaceae bacterium]